MKKQTALIAWIGVFLVFILIAGCTPGETNPTSSIQDTLPPTNNQTEIPLEPAEVSFPLSAADYSPALIRFRGDYFSTAGECGYCHTGMVDQNGADVSIETAWRAGIMANAVRDPYYRASVRSEVVGFPQHRQVIENKCAVCHAGMASTSAILSGQTVSLLSDGGFTDSEHPFNPLALDGVSCTVCHQIQAEGLGSSDSFSGGYVIDSQTAMGSRSIFGRFLVGRGMVNLMQSASGYIPQQAAHVQQSEVCAVCHDLFTPYITDTGEISTELFPEQTPYLEWQHSSFGKGVACQGCHMPAADGSIPISNTGGPARNPFQQHIFTGGNIYMLNLLSDNATSLGVTAEPEQLALSIQRTLDQLQNDTAGVTVQADKIGEELVINVAIQVQTGHKFPSGFPSRRAWIHLLVQDSMGKTIFESGAWAENGMILENDNDIDETRYEPHFIEITSQDQVQIYESIIGDPNGAVTTTLLRAQSYLKDNRLLPFGFDKISADPAIAVRGEASEDTNFMAGGDQITYRIATDGVQGPFTVQVELLYQTIGFRWSEKFRGEQNPEGSEFYAYVDSSQNLPMVIASQTIQVE